jgi:receptor protein-tyrosine kinase
MKAAYARQMSEVQRQTEKTTHYNVLKREVDTTQRLYDAMLQKLKEAGAASALRATNARIIDPATPPSRPFSPNLPLNLAIGLAAGLLGGLGLVLVQERSDKVRRPGDATVELPELGVIPSARSDRAFPVRGLLRRPKPGDLALVTWKQDSSLLSESFRAARASILFSSDLNRPRSLRFRGRILVVTSNEPMEGKTTVVTNLGVTLAETHRRVLLIDADLRRPKLHDVFDLCNDWGLSDLLSRPDALDSTPVESLARPTAVPNLFVLPSGPGAAGISSLLHSSNLSRLLRHLRTEFDLILIDTAPLTLYSDSRVLGRQSDGVVLVVRANRTSRDDLRNAHQRLVQDGIPVLGTILNDWRIDKTGSRAYGKYYKWYGRSEATT